MTTTAYYQDAMNARKLGQPYPAWFSYGWMALQRHEDAGVAMLARAHVRLQQAMDEMRAPCSRAWRVMLNGCYAIDDLLAREFGIDTPEY